MEIPFVLIHLTGSAEANPGSPVQVLGASGRRIGEEGKGVLVAMSFTDEKLS